MATQPECWLWITSQQEKLRTGDINHINDHPPLTYTDKRGSPFLKNKTVFTPTHSGVIIIFFSQGDKNSHCF